MHRIEELLMSWENETITEGEMQELKHLLADPVNRRQLASHMHTSEMIATFFKERSAVGEELVIDADSHGKTIAWPLWAALAAAACLLAALGVAFWPFGSPSCSGILASAGNGVKVQRQDDLVGAFNGMKLISGDMVVVPAGVEARVIYEGETTTVDLAGGARAGFGARKRSKEVVLEEGALSCDVAKQRTGYCFILHTPHALAEIVGTKFVLAVAGDTSRLSVQKGVVRLTQNSDGASVVVKEGQYAVAAKKGGPLVAMSSAGAESGKMDAGALLGATGFYPSAARPMGWRGDWTGKFTGANPPVTWSRLRKWPLQKMRWAVSKPADNDTNAGKPVCDGIQTEWLVAGPLAKVAAPAECLEKEYLQNAQSMRPSPGDKAGATEWRICRMTGIDDGAKGPSTVYAPLLSVDEAKGESCIRVFYVHAYVWSDKAQKMSYNHIRGKDAAFKLYLNNDLVETYDGPTDSSMPPMSPAERKKKDPDLMTLKQGWNSLMFKLCTSGRRIGFRLWPSGTEDEGNGKPDYETANIKYMTLMPEGRDVSTPVIVGNRIFITSEPCYTICIDRDSGKVLWARAATVYDALSKSERENSDIKAQVEPLVSRIRAKEQSMPADLNAGNEVSYKIDNELLGVLAKLDSKRFTPGGGDGGRAAWTPCSDGKNVYVFFGTGVAAAYDLDGNLKWANLHEIHDGTHHGFCSSPVLIDGRFIIYYRAVTAYDAETGRKTWQNLTEDASVDRYVGLDATKVGRYRGTLFWSSLIPVKAAGANAVYLVPGIAMRVTDGKVILNRKPSFGSHTCPTPVMEDGLLYHMGSGTKNLEPHKFSQEAGDEAKLTDLKRIPISNEKDAGDYFVPSPLIFDGLAYLVGNNGRLYVLDIKSGMPVYSEQLDLRPYSVYSGSNGMDASPLLGGKYIYIMDNQGNTIVIEPGRTFKQVARNALQDMIGIRQVFTQSSPVACGNNLFIRTDHYLYCLQDDKQK